MLPLSVSNILSFPQGYIVGAYVFDTKILKTTLDCCDNGNEPSVYTKFRESVTS